MHRRNASLPCDSCDFLISTATTTTTVFIHTLKQGRVALRSHSSVCAFRRRKSIDGIQREEVCPAPGTQPDAGSCRAKNHDSDSWQYSVRGIRESHHTDGHR